MAEESVRQSLLPLLVLVLGVTSCGPPPGGVSGDAGEEDSAGSFCSNDDDCEEGEDCRRGVCIKAGVDRDGDGIFADRDCDDDDADIRGSTATRVCLPGDDCAAEGACGPCNIECTDGVWEESCEGATGDVCACAPGASEYVPCGNCGQIERNCSEFGLWEVAGECEVQGSACTPGSMSDPLGTCGACGELVQRCDSSCQWNTETICTNEAECVAGEEENEYDSCGSCGRARTNTRTCTSSCDWGDWSGFGECESVDGCDPSTDEDEIESEDCELCGTRQRTRSCDSETCLWTYDEWGDCEDQAACEGDSDFGEVQEETETIRCGPCDSGTKTRTRTCAADCSWPTWQSWDAIACEGSSGCLPGTLSAPTRACGACDTGEEVGQQVCTDSCEWSATTWSGVCSDECQPGASETEPCGTCGSRSRSCDSSACEWNPWSTCDDGEAACDDGDSESCSCACGSGQIAGGARVCDASCEWGACSCSDDVACTYPSAEVSTDYYPAGAVDTCGNRYRQQTRSCQLDCAWTAWGDWSGFTGGCQPGSTRSATPRTCSCSADNTVTPPSGQACTEAGTQTCTSGCSWGGTSWSGTCACPTTVCQVGGGGSTH